MKTLLVVTAVALFLAIVTQATSAPIPAATPVPNFQLVNQDGKPFQLYDLKGKYVFVSFVFSRCPMPKMCPLTMSLTKRLVKEWEAKYGKNTLIALAVTLDPAYDTPKVLKQFGRQYGVEPRNFTLATGNPQTLSDFASQFNVIGVPSGDTVSHNSKSVLLNPQLAVVKEYKDNEWTPQTVLKDR